MGLGAHGKVSGSKPQKWRHPHIWSESGYSLKSGVSGLKQEVRARAQTEAGLSWEGADPDSVPSTTQGHP